MGILEATGGMAQYGGLTLPARGGLWDGGSLLTTVAGTSEGGEATEAAGVCFSAIPDGAEQLLKAPPRFSAVPDGAE